MPRFAANLTMLYNEHAFLDRFSAASADGFAAVEFLFPYGFSAAELALRLRDHGLQQVLFNAPPGDWQAGERGLACLPGRETDFRDGFHRALAYAEVIECPRIHVMAGVAPQQADPQVVYATYLHNLSWAASVAASSGRDVLIEPINPRDMPGYYLNRQDAAHAVVQSLGAPNLKVQMDLYHCQIVEGDLAMKLRHYLATGNVGHIQIAGVPTRHEPDDGEVNYAYLFSLIDSLGFSGWLGCEYRPADTGPGGTSAGLGWFAPWRAGATSTDQNRSP